MNRIARKIITYLMVALLLSTSLTPLGAFATYGEIYDENYSLAEIQYSISEYSEDNLPDALSEEAKYEASLLEEPIYEEVMHPEGFAGIAPLSTRIWFWPVPGKAVSSPFGYREGTFHPGIDIAAPQGTNIRAARGGTVDRVGTGCVNHNGLSPLRTCITAGCTPNLGFSADGWCNFRWGNFIRIDHGGEVRSLYAHNDEHLVSPGDQVTQGQIIALMGSTGASSGPHLHFEIFDGGIETFGPPSIHGQGHRVDPQSRVIREDSTITENVTPRTVNLRAEGGTVSPTVHMVNNGTAIGTLPTPGFRVTHDFRGWYTAPAGGVQIEPRRIVTANMNVYARWIPVPYRTVRFNSHGSGFTPSPRTLRVGHGVGTAVSLPTVTRLNHTFDGWWTTASGPGTRVTNNWPIPAGTGDITLHARWRPDPAHTITFNSQGIIQTFTRSVVKGRTIGTLPVVSRTNHAFNGWWTTASGTGTRITSTWVPSGNTTLHARWTPLPAHTITFNTHGSIPTFTRSVVRGQTMGTLPVVSRTNHTFNGWWTTATTGGSRVTNTFRPAGNVTLHARWISNAPTAITINRPASNIVPANNTLNLGSRLNFTHRSGATQDRSVIWTSSNVNVATVNASGVITGRSPGTAIIRVRSSINTNATATFTVRVEAAPTGINTATQSIRTLRIRQGRTVSLPIVVRGSAASSFNNTPVTIDWRTSNRNVATLRGAGSATNDGRRAQGSFRTNLNATRNLTIRAVGTGTTSIVLTSQNGRQRTIRVTVVRDARPVTNVRIGNLPSNNTMNRNRTRALTPRIAPSNATLQGNIRWTSSNRRVATIDGAGRVTTHSSGTTNITLRVGGETHRVTLRVR